MATKSTKEKVVAESVVDAAPKKPAVPAKDNKRKTLPRLDDTALVEVRSNQYGILGFTNSRTGDRTVWHGVDDVQTLTVGDIRNMKTSAPMFFSEPWIWIESVDIDECDELTEAEIYEVLGLAKYYQSAKRPRYLSEVYKWDVDKIETEVPVMTQNSKSSIAIALNTAIRKGQLDNLTKIKAWEKALGLELDRE